MTAAEHAAPTSERYRRPRPTAPRRLLGVLFAVSAAAVLAACGSSSSNSSGSEGAPTAASGLYGSLPPVGKPSKGGTITVGQLTGSTPTYIFPIEPSADGSVYTTTMIDESFLPLYASPLNGSEPAFDYSQSLANKPTFTNGDKTVTIPMKTGYKWADGNPVGPNDLLFEIDLLKAAVKENPANWSQFTPGYFPDNVKSATVKGNDVVLQLTKAYNPGFFLNNQIGAGVYPLPSKSWNIAAAGGPHMDYTNPANAKKIYDFLAKAGGQLAKFATNPLWQDADGPFKLKTFSATNSSFTMVPNPAFGGSPKPSINELSFQTYTGITPQLNALRTGSLDISGLDFSQLGQVGALKSQGYSVFGLPSFGWFGAIINFKDATNHFDKIMAQPYARQVLVHLIDQPAYLKGIFKNAGAASYGPVPTVPKTPYAPSNALTAPYPFSISTAASLLKAHGWKVVPNGQTTCAQAGSGANQCGAGIPAGTPFKFTWFFIPPSATPSSSLESEAFASDAKKVGIQVELHQKTFNFLIASYNDADPAQAKNDNAWGVSNFGGFTIDNYPTMNGIFNTGAAFNQGAYDDPTADKLIHNSVFSSDPSAVTKEASYLTKSIPVLFMPNSDQVLVVSKRVGGPPNSFLSLTQFVDQANFWYVNKK